MDKTETNIKMCGKAVEVQAINYKEPLGSWLGETGLRWLWEGNNIYVMYDDRTVWLPHQDQLQEMVFDKDNDPDTERAERITQFYHFCMQPYRQQFVSMEQLWLAFVMKEKYSKVWDGEDWEKVSK